MKDDAAWEVAARRPAASRDAETVDAPLAAHALVRTLEPISDCGVTVPAGTIGTIVFVHAEDEAFEVELDPRFETVVSVRRGRVEAVVGAQESRGENVDMVKTVPASEFTRNFGHYRLQARHEPVAVSSKGAIAGYFVSPEEYEEYRRYKQRRRSFATAELSDEKAAAIGASRMDPRHSHLDSILDV